MTEETPAQLRLSRALAHEEVRYKRALSTAKKLSKNELAKTAVHLLMQLMRERAFADRIDEVRATHHERWTLELRTERDGFRAATLIEHERRVKGGETRAAKYAAAKAEVRALWASADKRGRGRVGIFASEQAANHAVRASTIKNWLKPDK